jgi:ATP-dependent protease HslVU (ClpYQ) ATPase subunit
MSYELYALLVPPGQASEDALATVVDHDEILEAVTPLDPAKEARKRSIASALAQARLGYEVVEHDFLGEAERNGSTEEEMRRRLRHVQVDNGTILVEVDEEHAHIEVPYSSSLQGADIAETIFQTLKILRHEAKLVPFDPQLQRELDLERDADRQAVAEAFDRGVEEAARSGTEEDVSDRPRSPWWRRLLGG